MRLHRVLGGHDGWVWDVCMDPENEWFATASADQTIRVWGLATGELKLVLTGHRMAVRALAISQQMPYMFSGSEDKQVCCWDLEHNKVVRNYHGHRSGVYTVALHPEIPYLLASGSRDSSVRLWDVRTRTAIRVLNHDGPVNKVVMQSDEPQLISGSQDRTVKLWDIISGRCQETLTTHSHSVRALACHPTEYTFVSAAKDAVRQWKLPGGESLGAFDEDNEGVYTLSYMDDKLYTGGESGTIRVYDNSTGELDHELEAGSPVMCSTFDASGSRFLTGHLDKSVRLWVM